MTAQAQRQNQSSPLSWRKLPKRTPKLWKGSVAARLFGEKVVYRAITWSADAILSGKFPIRSKSRRSCLGPRFSSEVWNWCNSHWRALDIREAKPPRAESPCERIASYTFTYTLRNISHCDVFHCFPRLSFTTILLQHNPRPRSLLRHTPPTPPPPIRRTQINLPRHIDRLTPATRRGASRARITRVATGTHASTRTGSGIIRPTRAPPRHRSTWKGSTQTEGWAGKRAW